MLKFLRFDKLKRKTLTDVGLEPNKAGCCKGKKMRFSR